MPVTLGNPAAGVASRNLESAQKMSGDSMRKLASGLRAESARDDAASLAIGSRLRAELAALNQVSANAQQSISLLQIAEGAMGQVQNMLTRQKALAVQASSGHISDKERVMLNAEYQALIKEINRIAAVTSFSATKLTAAEQTVTAAGEYVASAGVVNISAIGNIPSTGQISGGAYSIDYALTPSATAPVMTLTITSTGTPNATWTATIPAELIDNTNSAAPVLSTGTAIQLTTTSTDPLFADTSFIITLDAGYGGADTASATLTLSGKSITNNRFKVGTGSVESEDVISFDIPGINTKSLGIKGTSLSSEDKANQAAAAVTLGIDALSNARALVGAAQNRLEVAGANLAVTKENIDAARGSFLDVDVASEMSKLAASQILTQVATSMLAQANQSTQSLLRLFQG